MNNEQLNEDACPKCKDRANNHARIAKNHESGARGASDPKIRKGLLNAAKFERSLISSAKCPDCKNKKVDENYYAPRNVVAGDKPTLGDSTNDTVYGRKDRLDRIYQPSKQDATDNEHEQKVKVPSAITAVLTSRAADARAHSEKLNVTQTDDKQFYLDLAQAFDDLNNYLKSGTVHDIKMASIFLNSLMGPMLYEVPTEVVRFIAYGGEHAPLKSFMNSISDPKNGFNTSGDLDKL